MFLNKRERDETVWACRFCMMCHCADRVAQVVRRESYTPRGRGTIIFALDNGLLEYDEAVADIMYTTLNDRTLQTWCVGNYDHEELITDTRSRIFKKGLAPKEVIAYAKDLRNNPEKGKNPEEILSDAGVKTDPDSGTLLFCGRTVRNLQPSTLIAAGRLFNRVGETFKVLSDEPASGWSSYQLGDFEGAEIVSKLLATKIKESQVSSVAVLDADCYRMLMGRTGRFGGELNGVKIRHINALMAGWIKNVQLAIAKKISKTATYHDPCILARFFEDFDSPRFILSNILQSELKEMTTCKKSANCCGAGGMLAVHRPDVSEKVAILRLKEAVETGASLLISGCPRCDVTLKKAMVAEGTKDLNIVNLVDIVAKAAGLDDDM